MPFFSSPTSFRLNSAGFPSSSFASMADSAAGAGGFLGDVKQNLAAAAAGSAHPDFAHLVLLVFEAVLEVVCVSLPGYIVARQGMFDAEAQKFVANLNVQLFTPCLIFTKLASQLTADKLAELAVIPFIFVVQTLVSYLCAIAVSRAFGFKKRPSNFVIAMAVFGNSNSLPISLVISLSKTLKGLHWDQIPGDTDDEVAARGILYLLIFQQLGQLVRWTWGYNVLLAPADTYKEEDGGKAAYLERGEYYDNPEEEQRLIDDSYDTDDSYMERSEEHERARPKIISHNSYSDYASGNISPATKTNDTSVASSSRASQVSLIDAAEITPTNGNVVEPGTGNLAGHAAGNHHKTNGLALPIQKYGQVQDNSSLSRPAKWWKQIEASLSRHLKGATEMISALSRKLFSFLPAPVQTVLSKIYALFKRFMNGLWAFMNPPLWAMVIAVFVASIPALQHLFFDPGTFVNNSVTRAVSQSGGVAVPLILVVLGANLARNTLPKEAQISSEDPKIERNLLIACLVSRMLLPTIFMTPVIALTAKYIPVSILDDPIFVIVCFLLIGAPSALQLAQICQINNVYMGAMSKLLFQSYVVWILPSTLLLVTIALEVVKWAVL